MAFLRVFRACSSLLYLDGEFLEDRSCVSGIMKCPVVPGPVPFTLMVEAVII